MGDMCVLHPQVLWLSAGHIRAWFETILGDSLHLSDTTIITD